VGLYDRDYMREPGDPYHDWLHRRSRTTSTSPTRQYQPVAAVPRQRRRLDWFALSASLLIAGIVIEILFVLMR